MGLSTPSTGGGAPKDAEYVTGSSNSELTSETVVSPAGDILVSGDIDGTVSLSPGFGSYTQVSSTNPALLFISIVGKTDGSSSGQVRVAVDESGGTTADYTFTVAQSSSKHNSGVSTDGTLTAPLPAGAQFEVINFSDPLGDNKIRDTRALILSP